jgi:hypothetical protein
MTAKGAAMATKENGPFTKGKFKKWKSRECMTVQQVIDALKTLPPNLPTNSTFDDGVMVMLMNRGCDDEHACFADNDGTWDDVAIFAKEGSARALAESDDD